MISWSELLQGFAKQNALAIAHDSEPETSDVGSGLS
jgi:hypothetical protein